MALGQKQRALSVFVGMATLVVVAALIPVAARAQRGGAGIPRGQDSADAPYWINKGFRLRTRRSVATAGAVTAPTIKDASEGSPSCE